MSDDLKALQDRIGELEGKLQECAVQNQGLNDRVIELYTLYNVSKTLATTLDMDKIFELTMELFKESFQVDEYSIMLMDEETNELKIKASYGISDKVIHKVTYKLGEDVPGLVAETGSPILVKDAAMEPRFHYYKGLKKDVGSFLSVPLLVDEGKEVIGVLNAHKPIPNSFTEKDLKLFTSIANQLAISIEKARIHQRTIQISITDELTGIFNRRYFNDRYEREVSRAYRYQRNISVIMIDVDYFKVFNDTHGHVKGDYVLKGVSSILKTNVRNVDIVARFGGEEFIVLLPETNKSAAVDVAEKLRKRVADEQFEGQDKQPNKNLTISLGVSNFPADTQDAKELLDIADKALYVSKFQGRNRVSFNGTKTGT